MRMDIKENKSSIQSQYRPDIDGLRAFAGKSFIAIL